MFVHGPTLLPSIDRKSIPVIFYAAIEYSTGFLAHPRSGKPAPNEARLKLFTNF